MRNLKFVIIVLFCFLACNTPKNQQEIVQSAGFDLQSKTIFFDLPEGIWFSSDHPDSPDLDEDRMQFRLMSKK